MRGVLPVLGASLLVGSPLAALAAGEGADPAVISEHANLGFGRALAADGDRLAVGVPGDDSRGFEAGAVHVYRLADGRWELQARLLPPSDGPFVRLGGALALQGDRLLVGASEPDEVEGQHGVAYLFEADGERWKPRERWLLDEAALLGETVNVAIDGSTLAFGASFYRPTAETPGGRVRILHRTGDEWVEEADLLAEPGRGLGDALVLRGSWLLVRSRGSFSSRIEIYRRYEEGGWARQDDLPLPPTASDASPLGAMAVHADTLVILDDDRPRLHLYALGADGWRFAETRVLDAMEREPGDAVAIGPGRIAFATHTEDFMSQLVTEQVHLLRLAGDGWVDDGVVDRGAVDLELRTDFGHAVALADDELLVAAPDHGATWFERAGQVHAHARGSQGWKDHQVLGPDDPLVGCELGGELGPLGLGLLPLLLGRRRRLALRTGGITLALALLATPRPADACTKDSLRLGLTVDVADFEALPMPVGGVIAARGVAYGVDIDAAMLELKRWQVFRDGDPQTGIFETHRMFDAAATPVTPEQHVFILVWRPDVPFESGPAYRLTWEVEGSTFGTQTVAIMVGVGPPPPLKLPSVLPYPRRDLVDGSDEVCCQTGVTSCGTSFVCEPMRGTLLPTIGLEIDGAFGSNPQQRMWVGRVRPDGSPGPAEPPRSAFSVYLDVWIGQIRFDAPADEYCVVVGVASLVDGEELRAPPLCVSRSVIGVPEQAELEPSAALGPQSLDGGGDGKCIGPLVYQEDGASYPREAEAESGCRLDPRGGGAWLLLPAWLALTRRRRARG